MKWGAETASAIVSKLISRFTGDKTLAIPARTAQVGPCAAGRVPPIKRLILPGATRDFRENQMPTLSAAAAPQKLHATGVPPLIEEARLRRENAYLKARNAQLQDDVTALGAETQRLRQIVDRIHTRSSRLLEQPSPLGGGQ